MNNVKRGMHKLYNKSGNKMLIRSEFLTTSQMMVKESCKFTFIDLFEINNGSIAEVGLINMHFL